MINKQKLWFLTLFSLILVLSIYYITMPSEILTANKGANTNKEKVTSKASVTSSDILTAMQVELDEERIALAAEYNEILVNNKSTPEEKNNAYEGLKKIDDIKAKEESLEKLIKKDKKLESFVKIDGNNISITIKKKDHDYSLANEIMRLIQNEFTTKMYISIKFQK